MRCRPKSSINSEPQLLFNYLGRVETTSRLFRRLPGAEATSRDPQNPRSYLLEINAAISDGRLIVDWIYCKTVHEKATIETLAASYVAALTKALPVAASTDRASSASKDFPDAELDDSELDELFGRLD